MQVKETWVLNWASLVMVFAFSMPAQAVPGDMDQDGDVDQSDFALFRDCFMGPQIPNLQPGCQNAQFDGDSDVDLRDLAGFQAAFTGSCPSQMPNDSCRCPIAIGDGTLTYSNVGATTDGPNEPVMCVFEFGNTNVDSDIWYCYTASCSGTALVSLCGSDYDTKLAVYAGCGCPIAVPLACSDDDCGTGVENVQSRVEISVTQGQQYMVRVGGYFISGVCTLGFCTAGTVGAPCTASAQCNLASQGDGRLTVGCNVDACANGSGDCFVPSPTEAPGCGDATCCAATCDLDRFCCDLTWNAICAVEAQGVCTGSFLACNPSAGPCFSAHLTPGCDLEPCCEAVCTDDPFCCATEWDQICVNEAAASPSCP